MICNRGKEKIDRLIRQIVVKIQDPAYQFKMYELIFNLGLFWLEPCLNLIHFCTQQMIMEGQRKKFPQRIFNWQLPDFHKKFVNPSAPVSKYRNLDFMVDATSTIFAVYLLVNLWNFFTAWNLFLRLPLSFLGSIFGIITWLIFADSYLKENFSTLSICIFFALNIT